MREEEGEWEGGIGGRVESVGIGLKNRGETEHRAKKKTEQKKVSNTKSNEKRPRKDQKEWWRWLSDGGQDPGPRLIGQTL